LSAGKEIFRLKCLFCDYFTALWGGRAIRPSLTSTPLVPLRSISNLFQIYILLKNFIIVLEFEF